MTSSHQFNRNFLQIGWYLAEKSPDGKGGSCGSELVAKMPNAPTKRLNAKSQASAARDSCLASFVIAGLDPAIQAANWEPPAGAPGQARG